MKFQWIIKSLWAVEQINDTFKKQTVVLEETTGEFPQSIVVDFLNDKVDALASSKEWDIVEVSVNHRAVQSKTNAGQRFNSLNGWKVETIAVSKTPVSTPAE